MFKFIHTSDWHLGQNFYGYDRTEEQQDFLEQLAGIVRKHQPDALLVSGDIFHTASPSNAAVRMYVNAMLNIRKACESTAIVVIAGNHDSASRLDSDRELWQLAGVTVLGGIARDTNGKADLEHHIIRLNKGIIAAVPFSFPSSFPMGADAADVERDQRQSAYFQALLDCANAGNKDNLPVVLMAHLAVSNSDFTGHERDMMMESVSINTLGQGYDYAALGHIHRPQQLDKRVRYCGTPIPVSFDEQCEHSVSIVEIDAHGALPQVTTKAIKNPKPLHTIPPFEPAEFDKVLELLQAINPNERAYIRLNVKVDTFLQVGSPERAALALKDKQSRYCEIKVTSTAATTGSSEKMTIEEFNKKTPLDIAKQFFIDMGIEMNEQQQEMFNHAYQLVEEENRQ